MRRVETDYLVVGAGAMGMAFTDAVINHADVHVTLVDRRHGPGGHWLDAYPFVRLHQASVFYGVDSVPLGSGAIQSRGPEAGLHERAGADEIRAYYADVLDGFLDSGKVTFLSGSEYLADGNEHVVSARLTGERTRIDVRRRAVDATYLSPTIPATTPPPFHVADDARVVTINELVSLVDAPSQYVVVGSGKTATDAIVWLVTNGVDPDRVVWVRPRDPWMLNRAAVQPDAAVAVETAAATMAAAAQATSVDDLFLQLEDADVMLRIDPAVTPTMAKTPTLAQWELDLLREVDNVVRLGHVDAVARGELALERGVVPVDDDALVVHCAASGLQYPPVVPIWAPDRIRLQTIRAGAPCFCAALAGYVEATREDDRERNRLCPSNLYGNSLAEWARMQARGAVASATYGAEPDIAAWANASLLNPSGQGEHDHRRPEVQAARARLEEHAEPGLARLAEFGEDVGPLP